MQKLYHCYSNRCIIIITLWPAAMTIRPLNTHYSTATVCYSTIAWPHIFSSNEVLNIIEKYRVLEKNINFAHATF